MKRIIFVLMIVLLTSLLLVGCKPDPKDDELQLTFGNDPSEVTIIKNGDFEPYVITGDSLPNFISKLNEVYYTKGDGLTVDEVNEFDCDYNIIFGGNRIMIKGDSFVLSLGNGNHLMCAVTRGGFSFLDEIEFTELPVKLSELCGFNKNDLSGVLLLDVARDLTLDVSKNDYLKELLLNADCAKKPLVDNKDATTKFVLSFAECEILIYDDMTISFTDNEGNSHRHKSVDDTLNYINDMLVDDAFSLSGYDIEQEMKAYHNNLEAEITDKDSFLSSLAFVKIIELRNKEHYDIGTAEYSIKIGEEVMKIHNGFVTVGDKLYAIIDGNFDFLKDLTYKSSSSGFLPWI